MPKRRRPGLSKSDWNRGPPLSAFRVPRNSNGSRSSSTSGRPHADNAAATSAPRSLEEEDIQAAPKSEDDEDDTVPPQLVYFTSDDEPPQGDIPQSNFGRRTAAAKQGSALTKRRLVTQQEGPIREQYVPTTSSEAQAGSSPPRRSKRTSASGPQEKAETEPFKSSAQPDMFGVITSSQSSRKPKKGYGAKSNQRSAPSSSFSPKTSLKRLPPEIPSSPTTPQKSLKIPNMEDIESPVDGATFKPAQNYDRGESPISAKKQFTAPPKLESPFKEEDSPIFRRPVSCIDPFDDSFNDDEEPKSKVNVKSELIAQSQVGFRLSSMVQDLIRDVPSQVDVTISEFEDGVHEIQPSSPKITPQALCPMCGEIVDGEFLENYHEGRMNIRIQAKFCRAHKKRSAQEVWTSRGYPEINWDDLDRRIKTHHQYLSDLLDGATSHYRELLKQLMKSGKNRTLKQAMMSSGDSLTPGYYGSKGQRIMSENIMREFSPTLRRIAVKDRLVSAQGVAGYVQAVLVPELAVLLIKKDMGVDVEIAREIMKESISLGDLVNEEAEDVVISHTRDGEENASIIS